LWKDQVNARGGLQDRPIELVVRDDGSDPAQARAAYLEFVRDDDVELIFGPYSSAITAAVAPVADEAGYPMLAAGAAADMIWKKGYTNVFGMWTPASRYSHGMLRLALEAGLRRVAVLHAGDEFSKAIASGVRKWAPFLALDVVLDIALPRGTPVLAEKVARIRHAGAQLVVVAGHFEEAVDVRRALAEARWRPQAYFATVGPALPGWLEAMGQDGDGAFATSIWEPHETVTYPRSQAFARAYRVRYGAEPSYHAATAYAAGQILEAAAQRAGSLDRERLRAVLFGLDTYSVIGRYAVDRTGMQVKRLPLIVQWQAGKKEIVWPEAVRSAVPQFGALVP
jgi:branched-chain amino acid transport system substrate-binding protein